jgi:hypothetical protein
MTQASISTTSAFLTNQEFLNRYDVRTIGDLLGDVGSRQSSTVVLASTVLTEFAQEASGEVEAAIYRGQRYTRADIAALAGNSLAYLKRLVADKMLANMLNRRPDPNRPIPPNVLQSLEVIEALANGFRIFSMDGAADAGKEVRRANYPLPLVSTSHERVFGNVNEASERSTRGTVDY